MHINPHLNDLTACFQTGQNQADPGSEHCFEEMSHGDLVEALFSSGDLSNPKAGLKVNIIKIEYVA